MKKWAHELNREFSKEEIQMAKKYTRTCLTSLAIKVMQIKTTLRFHLTLVFRGKNVNRCLQGCSKTGTLVHC
jgi:hypothetical protein